MISRLRLPLRRLVALLALIALSARTDRVEAQLLPPPCCTLTGSSLSFSSRTMTSAGGGVLHYNLYLDALHLVVWGDGADLSTSRFIAIGLLGIVTFYGSVPAHQSVPAGSYTDTLVATIYF